MSTAPTQEAVFGSCQERRLFPLHYAPDRLGNQHSRRGEPHVGPGCYDNHEVRVLNVCFRFSDELSSHLFMLSLIQEAERIKLQLAGFCFMILSLNLSFTVRLHRL